MNRNLQIAVAAGMLVFASCTSKTETSETVQATDHQAYEASIDAWHQEREASLQQEDGWLALAGLFWLNEGKNTFGSATDNQIVFPEGKIAPHAGAFILADGEVSLAASAEAAVTIAGQQVQQAVVYTPQMQQAPVMEQGPLSWLVIKRGDKYGIRLRDTESKARQNFTGIARYPVNEQWRVLARLEPNPFPKKIAITNVLGQTALEDSPGSLVFMVDGQQYRLDALAEGDKLFVIFADKTNGSETYGAGRYLYADMPAADGTTYLDFNKATNPPCAFVPYATCPLPPKQNFLPIKVPAGEKMYEANH